MSADESRTDPSEETWKDAATVRLGSSSIWIPSGFAKRSQTEVPFSSFRRMVLNRDGTELIIFTPDRIYTVEARLVGGPKTLAAIAAATQQRIVQHPQSNQWLAQLARYEALDRVALARPATASRGLVYVCIAIFVIQFIWGASLPSAALWFSGDANIMGTLPLRWSKMLAMGANAPALVAQGEYFRLATANLLHGDIVHAVVNLVGLNVLGPMIERLWGPWRFLIVFLAASIGGAAASTWWSVPLISVGASTGLMGLLGAYFVLWLRYRRSMPPSFVISSDRWVTLAIINGALWYMVPSIDHWGHLGGALVGAIAAIVMRSPTDALQTSNSERAVRVAAFGLLAVFLIAIGQAGWTAIERPLSQPLTVMLANEAKRSAINANNVAWAIATDPNAERSLLNAAERAAAAAVTHSDDDKLRAQCLDTRATALYRLGRFREAVETSWASVNLASDPVTQSQLTRFLKAYLQKHGPYRADDADIRGWEIALEPEQLKLTYPSDTAVQSVIALLFRGNDLEGSLWIQIDRRQNSPMLWPLNDELEALRHPDASVRLALLTTKRVTDKNVELSLNHLTLHPEIRSLP